MIGWSAIFSAIGQIFKPISEAIDNVHTSEEERLNAKAHLTEVQAEVAKKWFDLEMQLQQLRGEIIKAELEHGNWLTRSWRPVTMFVFLGLVVAYWFGYVPPNLSESAVNTLFEIIKWGLSGYVVGRSAEKVIPALINTMKKPEG